MTRPTQEQINGLKAGDRVLIEARVTVSNERGIYVVAGHADELGGHISDAAIHSILPREIKVGDRVQDESGNTWEVVSGPRDSCNGPEVALWRELYGYGSGYVKHLTVIP